MGQINIDCKTGISHDKSTQVCVKDKCMPAFESKLVASRKNL